MPDKRKMKAEEQVAEAWLRSSYRDITLDFEPDGNIPPDFLLGGSTAIEVRRLNETRIDQESGRVVGLNEDERRIWGFLERTFENFPSIGEVQYHVHIALTDAESMRMDKRISRDIKRIYHKLDGAAAVTDHPGFQLEWTPWTPAGITDPVIVGSIMNDNSGGWMEQVYVDNLTRVIEEKAFKIKANAIRHASSWWLVLVDYIFPGSNFVHRYDVDNIDKASFERIIVINQDAGLLHEW